MAGVSSRGKATGPLENSRSQNWLSVVELSKDNQVGAATKNTQIRSLRRWGETLGIGGERQQKMWLEWKGSKKEWSQTDARESLLATGRRERSGNDRSGD